MHRCLLPLYAFAVARGARSVGVLVAGLAAGVVLLAAGSGIASNPATSTLTVPTTAGQTVSAEWEGTIPSGANPTSNCSGFEAVSDQHAVTINVAPGTYSSTLEATFTFTITWADATHDEILTVLDPQGEEVDSSDGGSNVETVTANNLPPGNYTVLACAFAAGAPGRYTGE